MISSQSHPVAIVLYVIFSHVFSIWGIKHLRILWLNVIGDHGVDDKIAAQIEFIITCSCCAMRDEGSHVFHLSPCNSLLL